MDLPKAIREKIIAELKRENIPVHCKNCSHTFHVLGANLVGGRTVKCPSCGESSRADLEGHIAAQMKDVDRGLKDFERSLKKLGNIKF